MKKILLSLIMVVGLSMTLFSQTLPGRDPADTLKTKIYRSYADSKALSGLYVFVDCSPLDTRYRVHGEVSVNHETGSFIDVKKRLIDKVKKTYPLANGAIISFTNGTKVIAKAIEFDYRLPENHE